jgi:hypothetical protein
MFGMRPKKIEKEHKYDDFGEMPENIRITHTGNKPLNCLLINKIVSTKHKNNLQKKREFENEMRNFMEFNSITEKVGIVSLISIGKYIEILKKYIEVEFIYFHENIGYTCRNCSSFIDDSDEIIKDDEGIFICVECNHQNIKPSITKIIKENNTLILPDYITSFKKTIVKFTGEFLVPESFYVKLDNYFKINKKYKLMRENIKDFKYNKFGIAEGTSRRILLSNISYAFPDGDNKQYSKDINEILITYWGWKIPDITDNIDDVIKLDIDLYNFWNNHKANEKYKDRDAFLGNQFRLYAELKTTGVDVHEDFFDLQENIKSLTLHKDFWSDFCKNKGIKNVFE